MEIRAPAIQLDTTQGTSQVEAPALKSVPKDQTNAPTVQGTSTSPLPKKQQIKKIRAEIKELRKEINEAKSEAFHGNDALKQMQWADRFMAKEERLHSKTEKLKTLQNEGAGKAKKLVLVGQRRFNAVKQCVAKLRPSQGRVRSKEEKMAMALDLGGVVLSGTKEHKGALDFIGCTHLINAAEARLKQGGLTTKEQERLKDGIADLKLRRSRNNVAHDSKATAQTGALAAFVTANGASAVLHAVTVVSMGVEAGSAVGSVTGLILAPVAAALALDGLVAVTRNIRQARKDRSTLENTYQNNLNGARQKLQGMDDLLKALDGKPVSPQLMAQLNKLNSDLKIAQATVSNCDKRLIAGDLSKAEVADLKKQRASAQNRVQTSIQIATNLLDGKPGLEDVHKMGKAKQVLLSSVNNQDQILSKYLGQKLKGKEMTEYVRGAGSLMTLSGAGLGAAGAVATLAGGGLGAPVLFAGIGCSVCGFVTTHASGALVGKIRNLQLGKDRIRTTQFTETLVSQLKAEAEIWDSLSPQMQKQTSTHTMFNMLAPHYPNMPKDWGPKEWATKLANDPPKGREHKDLNMALELMLTHDNTKSVIGSIAKGFMQGVISRATREKKEKV